VDTVGAGDAFLAVAALCGRVEAEVPLASVLANLAGAIAANTVGNREAISRDVVEKNAQNLFKAANAVGNDGDGA
jgi:sugar/nucleoside kinase (ribokinase family)